MKPETADEIMMAYYRIIVRQQLAMSPLVMTMAAWERSAGKPWWRRVGLAMSTRYLLETLDEIVPPEPSTLGNNRAKFPSQR